MKMIALTFSAIACATALVTMQPRPASAQRLNYPVCAVYSFRTVSCAFYTMAQCYASVSGRGGYCEPNAWYQPPAKAKRKKKSS